MENEPKQKDLNPVIKVMAEYQAILEDDAGMRRITPMEQIHDRLKRLFGEDVFKLWETRLRR